MAFQPASYHGGGPTQDAAAAAIAAATTGMTEQFKLIWRCGTATGPTTFADAGEANKAGQSAIANSDAVDLFKTR